MNALFFCHFLCFSSSSFLRDLLPSPWREVVAPEVLVVVELGLAGAGVLAAEHPHLEADKDAGRTEGEK